MKFALIRTVAIAAILAIASSPGYILSNRASAQQAIAPPAPLAGMTDAEKRRQSFDIVWTTVNQQFYDPTFGGLNWTAVREKYLPRVNEVKSDQELYLLMQTMLNELNQSHFLIIPPEAIPTFPDANEVDGGEDSNDLDDASQAKSAKKRAGLKLTESLTMGIGIDLRVVNGSAVITRVEPRSPAAHAGLRPGFIIKKASGKSLDRIIEQTTTNPMWQRIIRPELHLVLLAGYINGESRTPVRLTYLDAKNQLHSAIIQREKLKGEMSPPFGNLPSMFTEFESRRLANGLGYIRFNAFMPSLMEKLCGALRGMSDTRGIVIDLRGNQGGLLAMIGGLSGLLEERQISMGTMESRAGRSAFITFPQKSPYMGELVFLIDGATQSAAEIFASAMQENGRASLVGERSAGNTLPSVIKELPTGALFQYAFANYRTPFGTQLEGRGVVPDVEVRMSRRALLGRGDPQLASAIHLLQRRLKNNEAQAVARGGSPFELVADIGPAPSSTSDEKNVGSTEPPPPSIRPTGPGETVITTIDLPPPAETSNANHPTVSQIISKYIDARGGRAALERVSSRITTGTAEVKSMNLSGTTELFEKAPDKFILSIHVPGVGTMQRGFDGTKGWWQDSLRGLIELTGFGLEDARRDATFYRDLKLEELYRGLVFKGTEKVGDRNAYLLQNMSNNVGRQRFYFDVETGLLLRRDDTFYEDYRDVDGIKLPFIIREQSGDGFNLVYTIKEIKHNVVIDDASFTTFPSCFNSR